MLEKGDNKRVELIALERDLEPSLAILHWFGMTCCWSLSAPFLTKDIAATGFGI